jgi:hypothetical protein
MNSNTVPMLDQNAYRLFLQKLYPANEHDRIAVVFTQLVLENGYTGNDK